MLKDSTLLTVPEAAKLLGVSRQATWLMIRRGRLAAITQQVNERKRILVRRAAVVALLADEEYAELRKRKERENFARRKPKVKDNAEL